MLTNTNITISKIRQFQTEEEMEEYIKQNPNDSYIWNELSEFNTLSESFIEKHQNQVHWGRIVYNQNLTYKFIQKFKHKINKKLLRYKITLKTSINDYFNFIKSKIK